MSRKVIIVEEPVGDGFVYYIPKQNKLWISPYNVW